MRPTDLRSWNADEALTLIIKHRLTSAGGVPWVRHPSARRADGADGRRAHRGCRACRHQLRRSTFSWLRRLACELGAAASSQEDVCQCDRDSGCAGGVFNILTRPAYGLTETSAGCIGHSAESYASRPASTGVATLINDVTVRDGSGREVARGTVGELWVRGPNVVRGYIGDARATAEAFVAEGWFRSGDSATMDEEGFVTIRGRIKELIVVKGAASLPS